MSAIRLCCFILTGIAALMNLYIYTYPSLTPDQCSWSFQKHVKDYSQPQIIETLRSLPYVGDLLNQYVFTEKSIDPRVSDIKMLAFGDPQIKGNWPSTPYIKRLDTYGNDYYLGHIYRTMKDRLHPTHVAVLGDLFSSQWIGDSEFFNRTRRYVTRLYDQPDEHRQFIFDYMNTHEKVDWKAYLDDVKSKKVTDLKFGYENVYDWNTPNYVKQFEDEPLFLNVSGNHDIGYSGDATWQHMTRYNILFGKDNYYIEYNRGTPEAWRVVVLNSLLLEGPALQPEFLEYTWEFLYQVFERKFEGATVLLTHVPFYKEEGLCVDGPYFDYYPYDYERETYKRGKLRSQNHLSEEVSQRVLNLVFGDYPGIILTGHDHEGCETYYNKDPKSAHWTASKKKEQKANIKEVTVRSMMGQYGGNTGIMTGHFNEMSEQWEFDFNLCPFIVQHVWWATKVVSIIAAVLSGGVFLLDL